jgi:hypothetical protein
VKTAAALVLLWAAPLAWPQDATISPQTPAKTAPESTQPAAPLKTLDQASKTAAKVNPEKEAAVRKLFEIQGTRKSMEQVFAGMRENMKPTLAKMLPPGEYQDKLIPLFFEKFQTKLKTDELLDSDCSDLRQIPLERGCRRACAVLPDSPREKIEFRPASTNGRDPNDSDEHGTGVRSPSHDGSAR